MAPRLSRRLLRRLVVAAGMAAAAAAVTVAEEPAVAAANATGVAEAAAVTAGSHLPLTTVMMTKTMLSTGQIRCTRAGFGRAMHCRAIATSMEK